MNRYQRDYDNWLFEPYDYNDDENEEEDFDEMAKKTVLKKVLKYSPMATELQKATSIDERTVNSQDLKNKSNEDRFVEVDWAYITDEETGEIIEG